MNLVELPTKYEADKFLTMLTTAATEAWYHIGGSDEGMRNRFDFYWMTTGEKVSYPLDYLPGEPNNAHGKEKCLSVGKHSIMFKFNDVDCWEHYIFSFVCQHLKDISEEITNKDLIF